jgi:hypothetical protein
MEKEIGTEVILFRFDAMITLFAIFYGRVTCVCKINFYQGK